MKAPRKLKKKVKLYLQAMNEKKGYKVKIKLIWFNVQTETYTYYCRTFLNKKAK
jgi:hypothetical protein